MLSLYPTIEPYSQQFIPVDPPHQLYVEECGNPNGVPVVVVHGGPGSGCNEDHRRLFDPQHYRIILIDQRGAGRSTPLGELQGNTTQALVNDMEIVREKLQISQWVLYGTSWGSTLSLIYAQTHPDRILGLLVRSIFLARPQDIEWLYGTQGGKRIFPDQWLKFVSILPANHRHYPMLGYYELLTSTNTAQRLEAAEKWMSWGTLFLSLIPDPKLFSQAIDPHWAWNKARIECCYFLYNCFLEPNQILRNMHRIQHLPGIILHGRYDLVCPVDNAWDLHRFWSQSTLQIIHTAGHTSSDPNMLTAILQATQAMLTRIPR